MIYKPPNADEPIQCDNATLGVKFSQNMFIFPDFLDKWKIPYKFEDLTQTPMGFALKIDKDNGDTLEKYLERKKKAD